jgi:Uma2 family endonuclease
MSLAEPQIRRWSIPEYYRMGELGWFDGQRVELIDGEIVQMAPQKDVHAAVISLTAKALSRAFGPGHWVRQQLPLHLAPNSEPEPDVAVVRGDERQFIGTGHPTGALLVVEVSDTTLAYDRERKASLYASAGIADYWIVNLVVGRLEVRRDPIADPSQPFGYRYNSIMNNTPPDAVSPLAVPSEMVVVGDLLP